MEKKREKAHQPVISVEPLQNMSEKKNNACIRARCIIQRGGEGEQFGKQSKAKHNIPSQDDA